MIAEQNLFSTKRLAAQRWSYFLLGLSSPFFVSMGGQLYFAEIVLTILYFGNLRKIIEYRSKSFKTILVLGLIATCTVTVSSLLNKSDTEDLLKIVSSLIVFILCYSALSTLAVEPWKYGYIFGGAGLGLLLATQIQPELNFQNYPWKFGFALPILILICLLVSKLRNFKTILLVLTCFAIFNLLNDYRSMALIVLVGTLFQMLLLSSRTRNLHQAKLITLVSAVIIVTGVTLATAYKSLVESGVLGYQSSLRLDLQGGGSPILMLLGGRNEIFFSLPAALQQPLLGYGATSPMTPEILQTGVDNLGKFGLTVLSSGITQFNSLQSIPTHSFTMDLWIKGGIAGVIFWLYVARFAFMSSIQALKRNVMRTQVSIVLFFVLWTLIFSPLGGYSRILMVFCLAYLHAESLQEKGT